MLSETLETGLQHYQIGPKIRALRQQKKLNLVTLGEHTGLSPGMLSKIERGQMFPTLPTLLRIALVFSVGLEHFFAEPANTSKIAVVRKKDRCHLPSPAGASSPHYFFESLDYPVNDRKLQGFYVQFPATSTPTDPHRHDGAELIYVISGQLTVIVGEEDVTLREGDSMYFDSGNAHSYQRKGRTTCTAIVVVTQD